MSDVELWPAPLGDPVLVLVQATTEVERGAIERWLKSAPPQATSRGDVERMPLADPESRDATNLAALDARLSRGDDPWLTPVRVVWLPAQHDGDRSVRMRDVVLNMGDPRRPRASRQRRIVQQEPDRHRVVVGEPARISALRQRWATVSGADGNSSAFAQFVARQATLALERAESKLVGARYKVPRLVRQELLSSARFHAGLARLARDLGRDVDEVTVEANSYLDEMVTGWSRLLIDLGVRLGRYSFRRGYDPELDFDPFQVKRLQDAAQQYPLVFLPSHKSNLDSLVMNVALHDNGLPRTHVFGGINMAFWPTGPIFRRAGTIFIRRNTRGKPVYNYTLREYIGYLIEKRFSVQFYVEGGRSRTGKLLPPRLGLLAYIADAYRQGRSEDVVLVPVSIAYDQLQEVGEFAREAKGASKSAESLGWMVRAFREQRGRYGKIYVRFGEPLSLRDTLGPPHEHPLEADTEADVDVDADPLALEKIAFEVSRRINEVTPITATSLVTLGLLGAQGRALTVDQVRATVRDPFQYAVQRRLPLTRDVALDSNEGVLRALHELERHDVVTRYAGGSDPVFAIGSDQHLAAAFYRNTIIHFFLHGALAQAALARASADKVEDPTATFWEAVLAARDLLKFEFFFEPREEFSAAVSTELAYQDPDWQMAVSAGSDSIRGLLSRMRPVIAHTVLRSFFEAYGVVAATLVRHGADELNEPEFLSECLALGQQYQLQQRIHSPESLSKPLFANALKLAASRGLIGPSADREGQRRFLDEVRGLIRDLGVIELIATERIVRLIEADREDTGV